MKNDSKVAALFEVDVPIVQGPFGGGLSTARLTAKVSNLGGLGSYGAHILDPGEIAEIGKEIRSLTERPFAINLWVSDRDLEMKGLSERRFLSAVDRYGDLYKRFGENRPSFPKRSTLVYEQQVEAVLKVKPKVFSFVFGIPAQEILRECKRRGIVTVGAATTIEEAMEVEAAGVDIVLATGAEAGGHRPWFLKESEAALLGTFPLIPQVRDRVKIPIIAAGGIADRRGVRAAMALGADGVQVGTAFLATAESGASELHKRRLLDNKDGRTRLSRAFTGRWARFLPNAFLDLVDRDRVLPLPFPAQAWLSAPLKQAATRTGDGDYQSLYASQAVPLVGHDTACEVFEELKAGLV